MLRRHDPMLTEKNKIGIFQITFSCLIVFLYFPKKLFLYRI